MIMSGAIHLSILIGPMVPLPAPAVVVEALTSAQVTGNTGRGGFQLTFAAGPHSPLLNTLLPAGFFAPMLTRVILVAAVNGVPNVLMDGIITRHEIAPSSTPGQSTLTITGEDLSVLMDVVEMPFMRYPAQPEATQINAILAKYSALGIVPMVVPPEIMDTAAPTRSIPTHTGTDLEYIRQMASRCGYVFYIEPGPVPGTSIAYFGPDVRVPVPQPALTINMDAHTNVESLTFSFDGTGKKVVVMTVFDPSTQRQPIPVAVPEISVLRPPLGAQPAVPGRVEFANDAAKLSVGEAAKRALAISLASSDTVTGSGSLDVLRYGRVLKARGLVGVRGAGLAYDGLYYVNSVTHDLKRGKYTQQFNLSRDGLVSTTPMVPV
jgi:hypothetical protein